MDFKLNKNNLNLSVRTAPELPGTGKENDIVVISDVPMANWILSPDSPSGAPRNDGDVWLTYSVDGSVFNALKQNTLMIAMVSAKQYIDGAWVDKTAKSYQNGEWVDWYVWDGALFPENPGILRITGGWVNDPKISHMSRTNVDSSTVTEDAITIYITGSNKCTNLATANEIDLTGYSHLKFNVTERSGSAEGYVMVYKDGTVAPANAAANMVVASTGEHTIALPSGGGLYRIAFELSTSGSARSLTISEVRLME